MSNAFDPYHRWLGIPPRDQPPHHYRLLGLESFEEDDEVIREAIERQIGHVRRAAIGEHADLAQRVLDELASASVILTDPGQKKAYDQQLRDKLMESEIQPNAIDPLDDVLGMQGGPDLGGDPLGQPMQATATPLTPTAPQPKAAKPKKAAAKKKVKKRSKQAGKRNTKAIVIACALGIPSVLLLVIAVIIVLLPKSRSIEMSTEIPTQMEIHGSVEINFEIPKYKPSDGELVFHIVQEPETEDVDGRATVRSPDAESAVGKLTWTPTEAGTFSFRLTATAINARYKDNPVEFTIEVTDPLKDFAFQTFSEPLPAMEDEMFSLNVIPKDEVKTIPERLEFALIPGSPESAGIDARTGIFLWDPGESDGGKTVEFTVRAIDHKSVKRAPFQTTFAVKVEEVNSPPVWDTDKLSIPKAISVGQTFSLDLSPAITDFDLPSNTINFKSDVLPEGCKIGSMSGILTWTPVAEQGGKKFTLEIAATDTGTPRLSTEALLTIGVDEKPIPKLTINHRGTATHSLSDSVGKDYWIQVAVHPNGKAVATSFCEYNKNEDETRLTFSGKHKILLWDIVYAEKNVGDIPGLRTISADTIGTNNTVSGLGFDDTGEQLVASGVLFRGIVAQAGVLNFPPSKPMDVVDKTGPRFRGTVTQALMSRDGRRLVLYSNLHKEIRLFPVERVTSSGAVSTWKNEEAAVVSVMCSSPNDSYFGVGCDDGKAYVLNASGLTEASVVNNHSQQLTAIAVSPNSKYLATGGADQRVVVWDIGRKGIVLSSREVRAAVSSVAFSSDNRYMAAGFADGKIAVWDLVEKVIVVPPFVPAGDVIGGKNVAAVAFLKGTIALELLVVSVGDSTLGGKKARLTHIRF